MLSLLLSSLVLAQHIEQRVEIAPGRIEEPCFAMSRGDRVDFSFTSRGVFVSSRRVLSMLYNIMK